MNGAQGEAPFKFREEDRHYLSGYDFACEAGYPVNTHASP
jgi:hypothetical protein